MYCILNQRSHRLISSAARGLSRAISGTARESLNVIVLVLVHVGDQISGNAKPLAALRVLNLLV